MAFAGSPVYAKPGEKKPFNVPTRDVHSVFVHCSASDRPEHDDVSIMREWHTKPADLGGRGWSDVGYHFFINKDGTVQPGRPLERTPAAQKDFNTGTIAICLHGLEPSRFTRAQNEALIAMCQAIRSAYADRGKVLRFRGHCEVANKACPVIDYRAVLELDDDGNVIGLGRPETLLIDDVGERIADPETLDLMDRGRAVAELQLALNRYGADLRVDGVFGQATRAAVIAFQEVNGLAVDGIVGAVTRATLRI